MLSRVSILFLAFVLFAAIYPRPARSESLGEYASVMMGEGGDIGADPGGGGMMFGDPGEQPPMEGDNWIVVEFKNYYRFRVYLWWEGLLHDYHEDVSLGEVEPGATVSLNTTQGHYFYVTRDLSPVHEDIPLKKLVPSVKVESGKHQYIFNDEVNIVRAYPLPSTVVPMTEDITSPELDRRNKLSVRIRSILTEPCTLWLATKGDSSLQAKLAPGEEFAVDAVPGQEFYATKAKDETSRIGSEIKIVKDTTLYLIQKPKASTVSKKGKMSMAESRFLQTYHNRTGVHWKNYINPSNGQPRSPPSLPMWPAIAVGQVHKVQSDQGYWSCNHEGVDTCKSDKPIDLELQVISQHPRVFYVKSFISDYEVDEIRRLAEPNFRTGSTTGEEAEAARASIARKNSKVMETVYLRAANLLKFDKNTNVDSVFEDMQVVRYDVGQEHQAHYDYSDVKSSPESRFATLLIYLTDMPNEDAGGETAFPEAYYYTELELNGTTTKKSKGKKQIGVKGVKIQPKKGTAIMFYNMLEDGNVDELSIHAGLPVIEGEKLAANLWAWEPRVRKN